MPGPGGLHRAAPRRLRPGTADGRHATHRRLAHRFRAAAVICGHLHVPRTTWHDGVRFDEVSLGYPEEWGRGGPAPNPLRPVVLGR